jgi:hypothetical protein
MAARDQFKRSVVRDKSVPRCSRHLLILIPFNSIGTISVRCASISRPSCPAKADNRLCRGVGGAARQETALLAEGVEVGRGALGERTVDFSIYGWFPDRLPSDEEEDDEEDEG